MAMPDFLTQHPDGEITVTGHRIGLYHIVQHYQEGFSPEMLACEYPTVPLAIIHKIIAYYLENRADVDNYVTACRSELDRQQAANARRINVPGLRERLKSRRAAETS
jgi:uncharacterized protein (DUF433 family)